MARCIRSESQWAAIRRDHVAGVFPSLNALGKHYGVSYRSIYNRRQMEPALWQPVSPMAVSELRVQLAQEEDVIKALTDDIRQEVRADVAATTKADLVAIYSLARQQADIIVKERADITGVLATVSAMMAELEESAPPPGAVQNRASLSILASRAKVAKDLVDVLKTLVGLQRQAFGISDNANGEANKPEEKEMSANEMAREIAFAMNKLDYTIEGEVVIPK